VIEHVILALVAEEPAYGLVIARRLAAASRLVESEGTVYPLLTRLRREGLVTSSWVESSSGPPRRYYELTAEGRDALDAFVPKWLEFRDAVDVMLRRRAVRSGCDQGAIV